MVAALFVADDGPYINLPDVDAWPRKRDAMLYTGPHPVVAHPPCSRWCKLAPVNQSRYGQKIGSDGGAFAFALEAVRKWGGVLEHPAGSLAWPAFGLTDPVRGGWQRSLFCGGWVCEVSQCAYGHRAEKLTWLYYFGKAEPPSLRWDRPEPSHVVSQLSNHGGRDLPRLSSKEASATPPAFREALIAIARSA
jgi:hypothetical protein